MKKTLILLLSINFALTVFAQGNSIPKSNKVQQSQESILDDLLLDGVKYRYPLFNGLSISANLFDPVMEVFRWNHANYVVNITADIHHRFFPQFSTGIGHSSEASDDGIKYTCKAAPFYKIGMLYNFNYNDNKPDNYYYVLLRYGFSKSTASIENMHYTDGYWNDFGPTSVTDQEYACQWAEIGGGIKVKLVGPISLGWEASFRPLISKGDAKHGNPYFIPGKGAGKFGFEFNLYYNIF